MNYFLLFLSVCANVAYSSFYNFFGKKVLKKGSDNYKINLLIYSVSIVFLVGIGLIKGLHVTLFTVLLGILLGVAMALSSIFKLSALRCGSMSFTVLIITASMIIPAFSGKVIWDEPLSIWKVIGTVMMLVAAYFSTEKQASAEKKKQSTKWLIFSFLAFLCQGIIGVTQKFQQKATYKGSTPADQMAVFLIVAFISATLLCLVSYLITRAREKKQECAVVCKETGNTIESVNAQDGISPKVVILCTCVCAVFITFMHNINLYLSGVLPSAFLFPVQNGGTTMVSVIVAMTLFREKISGRRIIGFCIALAALIILALSELL